MNNIKHFAGKSVPDHLIEARAKGALVSSEHHGRELSGAFSAGSDSLKETAIVLLLTTLIFTPSWQMLAALMAGWFLWKVGRSALLGWARLERLHRLIEEERMEVEHHRDQERAELKEMYEAKGFRGQMLNDVLDVLMADDNRLLMVMLEEELGLSLESYEHPLRQATGAGLGVIIAVLMFIPFFIRFQILGGAIASGLIIAITAICSAKKEKNTLLSALIWNLAVAAIAAGTLYFI
ncbi:MAG: VIT1/CCC1 transporter family protein [Chlamydiia bacterium]|nr:VIT1/CCC1 transporter family protein [Chlamydiia bacterium]